MNTNYYMLEQRVSQIQGDKRSQSLRNRRFEKARQALRKLAR